MGWSITLFYAILDHGSTARIIVFCLCLIVRIVSRFNAQNHIGLHVCMDGRLALEHMHC